MAVMSESERTSWLEWRRQGVGASDAAAICGLSPWSSPMRVWLEKRGEIPPADESEEMFWGSRLENVITDVFEDREGVYVRNRQQLVQHPERPWQRATLDGIVYEDPALEHVLGLYEGKTTSAMRHGMDWRDGPPTWVQLQAQHQMIVTGFDHAWVTCLVGGQRLRTYELDADEDAQERLTRMESMFWQGVLNDEPPADIDGLDVTTAAIRQAWDDAEPASWVELPDEALELVRRRQEAKTEAKHWEKVAAAIENRLCTLLREAESGRIGDREIVRWPVVERKDIDRERLMHKYPGIWRNFQKTTRFRRFTVRAGWDGADEEERN